MGGYTFDAPSAHRHDGMLQFRPPCRFHSRRPVDTSHRPSPLLSILFSSRRISAAMTFRHRQADARVLHSDFHFMRLFTMLIFFHEHTGEATCRAAA